MQNTHYEMLYREESGHWWYKVRRKIILIEEHLSGKIDNKKILWNLIVFQNWHSRFCMGNET